MKRLLRSAAAVVRLAASRRSPGRDLALLTDARAVEYLARSPLADVGLEMAIRDADAPFDPMQIGHGKGVLAARRAAAHASWAQRQLEWGEDFDGATSSMALAKEALANAIAIAALPETAAALPGTWRPPRGYVL